MVALIFLIAIFPRAQYAFGQTEELNQAIATDEIILTTKNTSRAPVTGPLSQGFTYYHPGIDVEQAFDSPIHPFLDGVVYEAGFQGGGYGNYVLLDHKNGYFSLYAHLNHILVTKDEGVTQDTVIGTVGLTGNTTGSHLHFEIYENTIAVNPMTILPESTIASASANRQAFIGGPANIPGRTLMLPISSQVPFINGGAQETINQEATTTQTQTTTETEKKPSLPIWLPDSVTTMPTQNSTATETIKASQLLLLPHL